ncbi:MAG: InlB B-repeat-containing protein, partial [Oscillospiraceae bacterium]
MALALCPVTAFAEEPNADATELQNLLNADGTVTLDKDYTINTTLQVNNTVTLDLNGHVIRMSDSGSGSVLRVGGKGSLTLQDGDENASHADDSDLPAGGVITGSNTPGDGGVSVAGGGSFTMSGGAIYNCSAAQGGGVSVMNVGFTMSGGAIRDCSAAMGDGGGVAVMDSSFTMSGGVIEGCSAAQEMHGDAVVADIFSHIVANGGVIKGEVDLLADIKNTSDEGGTLFYGPIASMGNIINNGRTVTFNTGESFYALEVVADGKQAVAPEAPTKGDNTFTGWYTDEALTTPYDFDS